MSFSSVLVSVGLGAPKGLPTAMFLAEVLAKSDLGFALLRRQLAFHLQVFACYFDLLCYLLPSVRTQLGGAW